MNVCIFAVYAYKKTREPRLQPYWLMLAFRSIIDQGSWSVASALSCEWLEHSLYPIQTVDRVHVASLIARELPFGSFIADRIAPKLAAREK